MTGTLVAVDEARAEYPYPVVTLGITVEAMYTGDIDGTALIQLLEPQRILFHIALDRSDAGWGIHGIADEPWPAQP